jgi:hypothetical protein
MPWITGGAPGVAARIDETLWRHALGLAPPQAPGGRFAAPPGSRASLVTSLAPSVDRDDGAIFEITLRGESCGANCESFTEVFAFEAATGRRIAVEDLLTAEGLRRAAVLMRDRRRALYAAQIEQIRKQQAAPGLASDIADDLRQRLALAGRCLAAETADPPPADDPRTAALSLPAGGAIVLVAPRCASHAERALDDVGDVTLEIPPGRLAPLLGARGRALLTPAAPPPDRAPPPA